VYCSKSRKHLYNSLWFVSYSLFRLGQTFCAANSWRSSSMVSVSFDFCDSRSDFMRSRSFIFVRHSTNLSARPSRVYLTTYSNNWRQMCPQNDNCLCIYTAVQTSEFPRHTDAFRHSVHFISEQSECGILLAICDMRKPSHMDTICQILLKSFNKTLELHKSDAHAH